VRKELSSSRGGPSGAGSGSSPTSDEALVGRSEVKPSGAPETPSVESPEREAAAEAPYGTRMSHAALSSALGSGRPLDSSVRDTMERRFGADLSSVRVHTHPNAESLCQRFAAHAFSYGKHIAFGRGAFAPATALGERLLRHELTHALAPRPRGGEVFRQGAPACPTTCSPGSAPPFVALSDSTYNCYAYAMNSPGSGFLQPGQSAGTAEFTAQDTITSDAAATAAQLKSIRPYFSLAGVRRNATADRGSPLATNCLGCCPDTQRKIVAVTTDAATKFIRGTVGGAFSEWIPMVTATQEWDHHWYRKSDDRTWAHKRGGNDPQVDDAAGATPICNPCSASRNYGTLDYRNVVGEWCVP